ncbi:uncharacterized protein AB675_11624 [Cyphellophora attinorum]|uniref:Uncharacterized protein n=1 Tax=Cyphellophora attinorum TaxID=1664694 RepID=A0A0N1HGN4_9EURO|nr:uncharacterized protein AB675_11624 [Phialophora attinorum]KPI34643.1 hypothetical protein AB675_11624 [Phialophora attinorum]
MAAPPEVTCTNLTGKFTMNKSLGDDLEPMLILQGIGWFVRKAIGLATPALTIKEYKEGDVYHIDILSVASGLSSQQENRTLDWADRAHTDRIFGNVKGRSRLYTSTNLTPATEGLSTEDVAFLNAQQLKDGTPSKWLDEGEHVQSFVVNVDKGYGWTAEQTWGFEDVKGDGQRRYTRRVIARDAKGKVERLRLVYDYTGPVEGKAGAEDDGLAYGDS